MGGLEWAAQAPQARWHADREPWGMVVSDGGRGGESITAFAFAFV